MSHSYRTALSAWRRFAPAALCLVLLPLSFLGCSSGNNGTDSDPVTITLLHTNDTHSQLESFTPYGEPEQGGVARRKTLIDAVRGEVGEEQVLLVDAGDFVQGTIFYNAWEGSADIMALNAMNYDAATLGNHEFDLGPEKLGRALAGEVIEIAGATYLTEAMDVPLVSTNLDVSAEPALAGMIGDRLVLEKSGTKIGILGVDTETVAHISNVGDHVVVNGYVESVQAGIDALSGEGVNKIVLLSHAGYEVDVRLAAQLQGVDIIVSGHDHPLLLNAEDYAPGTDMEFLAGRVVGAYPTVTVDQDGHTVLIVGAYEWGRILGRLDVTFDADGIITAWEGDPMLVDADIEADATLASDVAFYKAPISQFSNVIIGQAGVYFDGSRNPGVRSQEMPLGNLVADVILEAASSHDSAVAAIINGGGIRASLPQDVDPQVDAAPYEVTFGQALTVLPFGNTITTVDVSGEELVAALDNGLSWAYDSDSGNTRSSGAFPQVAGMAVTYCSDRVEDMHAGMTPVSACPGALRDDGVVTSLTIGGNPVDRAATYRIATNNYLAGGGDYYTSLEDACNREDGYCVDTGILMLDAFVGEFTDNSPVSRVLENRITTE